MLKFLPPKLASETLMELVDQVAPGRYDLFYYPRSRHRRKRNIDMCFINFVDHPSAVLAGEHLAKELESSWVAVRQAGVQGFLPNIAYYVTKSGYDALFQSVAPQIFDSGEQLCIAEAFDSGLISEEKIQAAARELEPRKSADESQAMVWELLVYDLERSGTSSQGGELKDWMKLMEGPPVANDIRVGSLEDFGLDLARILEHCEQVSVSL